MRPGRISCLALGTAISLFIHGPVPAQEEEQVESETVVWEVQSPLAGFLTAVNFPARGTVCLLAGAMGGVLMLISGGSRYAEAAQMVGDACSGPWMITDQMLEEAEKKPKQQDGKDK